MNNGRCQPGCGCGNGNGNGGNGGSTISHLNTPPTGKGVPLCWGIAGAEALVAPGATIPLTIIVKNYAWLQPRNLRMMVADPAAATDVHNAAVLVTVKSITGLGRQVIGSTAGVNAGALDAYADRSLVFGRDISPITSSNEIVVEVTNNSAVSLRVATAIEGEAQQ
jgi:hypothetical protein